MKRWGFCALALFFIFTGAFFDRTSGTFAADDAGIGNVKMRLVLVNPSSTKRQTKTIKNYLPKEVTIKDVVEDGGLNIEYDADQGLFYAYKENVDLAPLETKSFELVIRDVWIVSEEKVSMFRTRTDEIMQKLEDTPRYEQAKLLADTIYGRLEEIVKTQNDTNVSRQQHIAYYRDNTKSLEAVQSDIEQLEKILTAAGGSLTPDITHANLNVEGPSAKTTWLIIFIIIIFIAILGGAFYFTWQQQAKVTENIFGHEKEMTFSELSKSREKEKEGDS